MSVVTTFPYHSELIDGQEIEKPLPKTLHAIVQMRLIVELSKWAGELRLVVLPEQNVLCGMDRLVPDVVIADKKGPFENGDIRAEHVRVAVEIMSPGQTFADLIAKCERLRRSGVPLCWMIWPSKRKAWVYDEWPHEVPSHFAFERETIPLAVLFHELEEYESNGAA